MIDKELGKIKKNPETDIVIRIDEFGGKSGLTIREFITSDRYTGFSKSGTRIPAENFEEFKKMINSIKPEDMKSSGNPAPVQKPFPKPNSFPSTKKPKENFDDELSGIDKDGLM